MQRRGIRPGRASERLVEREQADRQRSASDCGDTRSRRRRTIHAHMLGRTPMTPGFICKGVVNGGRGHGVGYRPVLSFSLAHSLFLSLSLPVFYLASSLFRSRHQSPPRPSPSILIYERTHCSAASSFSKEIPSASLSLPLSLLAPSPRIACLARAYPPSPSFSLPFSQAWPLTRMATMTQRAT